MKKPWPIERQVIAAESKNHVRDPLKFMWWRGIDNPIPKTCTIWPRGEAGTVMTHRCEVHDIEIHWQ